VYTTPFSAESSHVRRDAFLIGLARRLQMIG
jgi:hypothetical protein